MKFLIKNLYLLSFIFSVECYEKWFHRSISIDKVSYEIHANIMDSNPVKIYINNNI